MSTSKLWRVCRRVLGIPILIVATLLLLENVFLNTALHLLVNMQPERVQITWRWALSLMPGEVEVWGLGIRLQDPKLQWMLTADHATGHVDVLALPRHEFTADHIRGEGATFRMRVRKTVSPPIGEVVATPPIEGLQNPPTESPEALYGPPPQFFRVTLTDTVVEHVRELWVEDYRFIGDARVTGGVELLKGSWLQIDALALEVASGDLSLSGLPIASGLRGQVDVALQGVNPEEQKGTDLLRFLTARVQLNAEVEDLRFLSFYLRKAPWLSFSGGRGPLELDVALGEGRFLEGSRVAVRARGLVARFLSYAVTGDGNVQLAVRAAGEAAEARLGVEFFDYAINRWGDPAPHVRGSGLRVAATTTSLSLADPFETLDVTLDLPESVIPDLEVYNSYLPRDLGFRLLSGSGHAHGHLAASTTDGIARGELFLDASGVSARIGALSLSGAASLHANLVEGHFETGEYSISGSTMALTNVALVAPPNARDGQDNSHAWWAKVTVPKATVYVGAPVFLDAAVTLKCRDSVPFVTLAAQDVPLPGWTRGLLKITALSGEAHLRLGDDTLVVPHLVLRGRDTELRMRMKRKREEFYGTLYARYGILSLGVELLGPNARFHPFGARAWFDRQAAP